MRTEGTALAIAALQSFYLPAVFPSSTNNACICVYYGLTTPNEFPPKRTKKDWINESPEHELVG